MNTKEFSHPFVLGLVGKDLNDPRATALKKKFDATFKKEKLPFAYLLLKTDAQFLKNLILSMKLMDVIGLNIAEEYQKKVIPFINRLDKSAKLARKVNTVAKQGRKFVGYYFPDIVDESTRLWSISVKKG